MEKKTILYYSGSAGFLTGGIPAGEPEVVLGDDANIMLSYHLITIKKQDQHSRFPQILKAREKT